MDDQTLRKAHDLRDRMGAIQRSMDFWEKQETPIVPAGVDGSYGFSLQGSRAQSLPTADVATWQAYRRASIEALQREFDKINDEFKRL